MAVKLNPDQKIVETIREGLQRTGGGDIRVHFGMAGMVSERGEQIPHLPDL